MNDSAGLLWRGDDKFCIDIVYFAQLSVFFYKLSTGPQARTPNLLFPSNQFPHRMKNAVNTMLKIHCYL